MTEAAEQDWRDARTRMAPRIEAVFWQDLGIARAENQQYVDWILDGIVRPEFEKLLTARPAESWCVVRLDDNGNEFMVSDGHSFDEAASIAHRFEATGHKQSYWVRRK
jgi:hypothetical protein